MTLYFLPPTLCGLGLQDGLGVGRGYKLCGGDYQIMFESWQMWSTAKSSSTYLRVLPS